MGAFGGFIAVLAGTVTGMVTGNWAALGDGFAALAAGLFLVACSLDGPAHHHTRYCPGNCRG